jgi:hypothetical protein
MVDVIVTVDLSIKANMAMFGRLQRTIVIMRGTSNSMKIKVNSIETIEIMLLLFVPSSSTPSPAVLRGLLFVV